jgi:hypothetical protein
VDVTNVGSGIEYIRFFGRTYGNDWQPLCNDFDGSDGWSCYWDTGFTPGTVVLVKAKAFDLAANVAEDMEIDVTLVDTLISNDGYQGRGGGGEGETVPSVDQTPGVVILDSIHQYDLSPRRPIDHLWIVMR